MQEIIQQFITGIKQTTALEYVAVVSGIASVWFSRKENILVYPVGLINTVIYVFLSFKYHLLGEAAVNFYYTVMSIYGWILWARRNNQHEHVLHITFSNRKEQGQQLLFFGSFYIPDGTNEIIGQPRPEFVLQVASQIEVHQVQLDVIVPDFIDDVECCKISPEVIELAILIISG